MLKRPGRRPLPPALRARLRQIPHRWVLCRDRERLYAAVRRRARGLEVEAAVAEHLADCPSCRRLCGVLGSALAAPPPPPPSPALFGRLRGLARRPAAEVPAWIGDSRYAAAACLLLTLVSSLVAGDSAALFRHATSTVSQRAVVWTEAGESRGRQVLGRLGTTARAGWTDGRQSFEDYGASCAALLERTVRDVGSLLPPDLFPIPKGDDDASRVPDAPRDDAPRDDAPRDDAPRDDP